jgi:transposase
MPPIHDISTCLTQPSCPDLTRFCRLDELGLQVTGQRLEPGRAVLACRVVEPDQWCRRCGCEGTPRDTVVRRLAHEPLGWRPTTLEVVVRRYRCTGCGHVWRQDTSRAAEPRAKLSRRGLRWALEGIVIQHLTIARVAEGLAVAWNTANAAVLAEGKRVLIDDEARFDGVKVIGVDEHVWRHTRRGDKYVTVIIDLTRIRDGTGPARLLDMVEGRSKQAFKTWLAERPDAWRNQVEVVAMDGFTGFKTATAEELPDAVAVMDPFHVVRLAGDALDRCRRRVQLATRGGRGRKGDPLYAARRTLHTGAGLLTSKTARAHGGAPELPARAGGRRPGRADRPLPEQRPGPLGARRPGRRGRRRVAGAGHADPDRPRGGDARRAEFRPTSPRVGPAPGPPVNINDPES